MKKLIKNWWFTVFCILGSLAILAYGIITLFLDEPELFFEGAGTLIYAIAALIFGFIGLACAPRKEKKDESSDD